MVEKGLGVILEKQRQLQGCLKLCGRFEGDAAVDTAAETRNRQKRVRVLEPPVAGIPGHQRHLQGVGCGIVATAELLNTAVHHANEGRVVVGV